MYRDPIAAELGGADVTCFCPSDEDGDGKRAGTAWGPL